MKARHDVWLHARKMREEGLVVASAGNVSARVAGEASIAVTPTSIPYEAMTVEQIAIVDVESGYQLEGAAAPSSEMPMHLEVYRARWDIGAIVHTHSTFVSVLAVLHKPLPPVIDEMMLYFGGTIEVTEYAFTGRPEVGLNVLAALGDRAGVILANHGNVCAAATIEEALHMAIVMESTAKVYIEAMRTGEPVLLPPAAIEAGRRLYEMRRPRR
jgi:L-fuculose-phosphate aldolase